MDLFSDSDQHLLKKSVDSPFRNLDRFNTSRFAPLQLRRLPLTPSSLQNICSIIGGRLHEYGNNKVRLSIICRNWAQTTVMYATSRPARMFTSRVKTSTVRQTGTQDKHRGKRRLRHRVPRQERSENRSARLRTDSALCGFVAPGIKSLTEFFGFGCF